MWCHLFSAAQLIDRDIHAANSNSRNLRRDEYLLPRDSQFAHGGTDYALGTYSSVSFIINLMFHSTDRISSLCQHDGSPADKKGN